MGARRLDDSEMSALVRELAELTGESQTEALRNAVKERLARKKHDHAHELELRKADEEKEFEETMAEIRNIQDEIRKEQIDNMLADDDLYDEWGAPR